MHRFTGWWRALLDHQIVQLPKPGTLHGPFRTIMDPIVRALGRNAALRAHKSAAEIYDKLHTKCIWNPCEYVCFALLWCWWGRKWFTTFGSAFRWLFRKIGSVPDLMAVCSCRAFVFVVDRADGESTSLFKTYFFVETECHQKISGTITARRWRWRRRRR